MAVAILATDSWIQHLPFEGPPRMTTNGPVDGVWYGTVSGLGDASGGNVSISARLSEARKEDWVYIVNGMQVTINAETDQEAFMQLNTGPLIPTASAVTNPTFNWGGGMRGIANNSISIMAASGDTGPMNVPGIPIFGDKRIAGIFLMAAAGFQTNVDGAIYTLSNWGWLIRYQGFFRNRNPNVG